MSSVLVVRSLLLALKVVGLGDVAELLLDGVSVDVSEAEGPGRGSRQRSPLGGIPSAWGVPHGVQAGSLDGFDTLLDGIETVHQCGVRLTEGVVKDFTVVSFVLNQRPILGSSAEKNHLVCLFLIGSLWKQKKATDLAPTATTQSFKF